MGTISKPSSADNIKSSEITIISCGTNIEGIFNTSSVLHIHGKLTGKIFSTNSVVVCKDGQMYGDIKADKVVISGKFEGNIDCDEIDILENGSFKGEVKYCQLIIEKNVFFDGKSISKV